VDIKISVDPKSELMRKKGNFVALLFCISALIGICLASSLLVSERASAAQSDAGTFKVGFVCSGALSDRGWNYAQKLGADYLETKMPNVKAILAENIPESAESERVLEKMIAQGCKLVFTTSYGFLDPALRVAARHPDVVFMQINRDITAKNLGTYFSWQYQPLYIAGVVAGHMTKTNKLGFIASHPVPVLLQAINAFTMGARSVNPKAVAKVVWINSWSDPPAEVEAFKGLAESGVDVVANYQDNQTAILRTAEGLGIYAVGCWSDAHDLAPKEWLTGGCLDWGPLYVKITKSVMDHTWKSCSFTCGMEGGYIKLSSIGSAVPPTVKKEALALEQDMKSGKFAIYKGPLKDREGRERLRAGQKADMKWLASVDFFVDGVEGSLPKK
jgi:basic membrane protein A